jgi:RimJ/RimL family protein N-acetyltransferase
VDHPVEIRTDRLLLRHWTPEDREPFAQLNADPAVNEFLTGPLTREQSDAVADRIVENFSLHGFGWWAVEVPKVSSFIGFVGLSVPRYEAHFTPCVEIGWRLARDHWGQGYATEAARAALNYGFHELNLPEIVSLTVPANFRSRHVMEKIGMIHNPAEDFEHPSLPEEHPLRQHVLYRQTQNEYQELNKIT